MTPFVILIFSFWNAMSLHCILEADNLFDFTVSQMKKNFALRFQVSPTTDLGEVNDEIWDLELTFR